MLKHSFPQNMYNSSSNSQHQPLFITPKASSATFYRHSTEQQQINIIRTLGKFLFQQQIQDNNITFDDIQTQNMNQRNKRNSKHLTIYERGKLKEKEKINERMQKQWKQSIKITKGQDKIFNNKINNINNTSHFTKCSHNRSSYNLYHPNYKKQEFVKKEIFKKKIIEQIQIQKQYQKYPKRHHPNPLLHQSTQKLNYKPKSRVEPHEKGRKKATAQQIDKIFDEVNKRGRQIMMRRQSKVSKYRQEQYDKQMQNVTFYPQFYSSQKLRNGCQPNFIQRLNNDHKTRQSNKLLILGRQLRKDSYEPKLNDHINSLSKSKINSFRGYDSSRQLLAKSHKYLNSSLDIYVNKSQEIDEEEERYLSNEQMNKYPKVLKANDLKFFFQ